jgi:thioredoxin-related protein
MNSGFMRRSIRAIIFLLILFTGLTGFKKDSPPEKSEGIHWITIEEAYARIQKEPRKVLVDVYTDWCGLCKVMDRETYKNAEVIGYINTKYYAVKLNAEQREAITLGNQKFEFIAQGQKGVHQIALALTNNQPSYPTTVFLDDKFQMIQPLPGYMKAKEFHEVITYFGENYNKKESFEDYKAKTYKAIYSGK